MSSEFSGADLIADALAQLGVEHVFAIVSIHNMPILDAINRLGKTKIIDVRHEQAGTHAADGYARASGKLGVMIASTGPGTSNTVTGLYEAQYGSSRVLVITGQAETAFYGKGLSYVHEAENQVPMLASVCRRVESPRHIEQLGNAFNAVVNDMFTGRGAPGALEIPIDIQYAATAPIQVVLPKAEGFQPDADGLTKVVEKLANARKRIIIAGGGLIAAGAHNELQALAEQLDIPVLTTVDGRGVIPETHPLCIGNYYNSAGMYNALLDADVTLAIGTKFAVGVSGQFAAQTPPGDLIHIDIDGNMIGRTHTAQIGLIADAKAALLGITAQLQEPRQTTVSLMTAFGRPEMVFEPLCAHAWGMIGLRLWTVFATSYPPIVSLCVIKPSLHTTGVINNFPFLNHVRRLIPPLVQSAPDFP